MNRKSQFAITVMVFMTAFMGLILPVSAAVTSNSSASDSAAATVLGGLIALIFMDILLFSSVFSILIPIFSIFVILFSIVGTVIWVFMLIDLLQRDEKNFDSTSKDTKLIWLLVVLFTHLFGAGVYYFMIYRKLGPANKK